MIKIHISIDIKLKTLLIQKNTFACSTVAQSTGYWNKASLEREKEKEKEGER